MRSSPRCILLALLLLDAIACVTIGARRLVRSPWPSAEDLYQRWVEERNLINHRNPAFDSTDAVSPYYDNTIKQHGLLTNVLYPPWAFVSELIFVLPFSWTATRWYFLAMSLAGLGALAYWANTVLRQFGGIWRAIGVVIPGAMWSVSYCLSNGQYAIIVTALLASSLLLADRGYEVTAGLLVGLSLLKPTLVLPFLVVFALLRKWKLIATAIAFNVVTALIEWHLTGCSPRFLLHQSTENLHHWQSTSQNFITSLMLICFGSNRLVETAVMAIVGAVGAGSILLAWRLGCSILTMFAIAAVTGLSWTYRKEYDAVVMVFLLIGLMAVVLKTNNGRTKAALFLCGIFLLLPFRLRDHNLLSIQFLELATWILGLITLMRYDRPARPEILPDSAVKN